MEIYRTANRMFMIMKTADDFFHWKKKLSRTQKGPIFKKMEEIEWTFSTTTHGLILGTMGPEWIDCQIRTYK